jgi:hypothetical protein
VCLRFLQAAYRDWVQCDRKPTRENSATTQRSSPGKNNGQRSSNEPKKRCVWCPLIQAGWQPSNKHKTSLVKRLLFHHLPRRRLPLKNRSLRQHRKKPKSSGMMRALLLITSNTTRRPSQRLTRPSASTPTMLVPRTIRAMLSIFFGNVEKLNKHMKEPSNFVIRARQEASLDNGFVMVPL